jgi:ABC-type glycerol-3-phosphate transport system substrate-binding protein
VTVHAGDSAGADNSAPGEAPGQSTAAPYEGIFGEYLTGTPYSEYLAQTGRKDAPEGLLYPMNVSGGAAGGADIPLHSGGSVELSVNAGVPGYYNIAYEYEVYGNGLVEAESEWTQNGEQPYQELKRITFPVLWQSTQETFRHDRYGDAIPSMQEKVSGWQQGVVSDSSHMESEPLRFYCEAGLNTFRIGMNKGDVSFRDFRLVSPSFPPDYTVYSGRNAEKSTIAAEGTLITMQAELPEYKNSNMIVPVYDKSYDAVPYESTTKPMNVIDETTWFLAGDTLFYRFSVPQDGYYRIALKYKQTDKPNVRVFRTITVDGEIPFAELKGYAFDYTEDFKLHTLHDAGGDYDIYLDKGAHELGLVVEASPYNEIIHRLKAIDAQISTMYFDLRKVAGEGSDTVRDWKLADYFPDMEGELKDIRTELTTLSDDLVEVNGGQVNSDQQSFITLALKVLDSLLKKPNSIPKKTALFTESSGSVSQLIAKGISDINMQAMCLDELYVYSPDSPPVYRPKGAAVRASEWCKRFFATFGGRAEVNTVTGAEDGITLEVWVNRSRNYVDVLQKLTDSEFTPLTNIKVNYYILADEDKLKLSIASGQVMDAVIGVSPDVPFEMGVRDAATDFLAFEDFGEVADRFPAGVFTALAGSGRIYGLPETLDFNVTFYRKDIMASIGTPIPDTWDDVQEIMPELQRFGMNYYTPMATGAGEKVIRSTAPFIMQNGGALYAKDGMSADLDDERTIEGIMRMCDLYTVYGLSRQVNSFFESFRSGVTPIGVASLDTYLQMSIAAPELMGNWGIALAPGTEGDEGTVHRQYPCLASASIIPKGAKHEKEAWELLKWWTSADVQSEYAMQMITTYGQEYFYCTANQMAFAKAPISSDDRDVILRQWESLEEVQYIPGWYLVEREISNTWNAVVFDDAVARVRIDQAETLSNKEIIRRMEEFGYAKDGRSSKPYPVYTVEEIKSWFGRGSV